MFCPWNVSRRVIQVEEQLVRANTLCNIIYLLSIYIHVAVRVLFVEIPQEFFLQINVMEYMFVERNPLGGGGRGPFG